MSHNRDLSAAAAQLGFHNSNIGIGTDNPGSILTLDHATNPAIQLRDSGTKVASINSEGTQTNIASFEGKDLVFATSGSSTFTERLRIDSSGNVGLGTDIIQANTNYNTLEITGDTNTTGGGILRLKTGNLAAKTMLFCDTGGFEARVETSHPIVFSTDNTERLRIQPSGYVGIGENAPGGKLTVKHANTATSGLNATLKLKQGVATNGNRSSLIFSSLDDYDVAAVNGVVEVHSGTSANNVGRLEFWTKASGSNAAERVRITSDGNMGLGVSPSYSGVFGGSQRVLHIGGTTAPGLRIQSSTSNQGDFIIQSGNSGGSTILSNLSNNADTLFYNTSGGSLTEKMRIRAGGMITTPDQPAFNAKLSTATGQNFNGTLVFNTVQYNIGSHYNGTNGRFTAPVDGRYLFNWYTNVDTNSNSTSLWGDWLINGNYSGFRFYTYVTHGGWELLTASIIFDLNTNDYVNVWVSTSGNYDGGQYGSFNGCLLG